MLKNGLYIVCTPIGNLADISKRAIEVLDQAEVVACEDTRMCKKLFSLLGLKSNKKFICYEDHREEAVANKILDILKSGISVALVSDAGAPLISDPGYKLVRLCRQENIYLTVVPGACAVISALQLSGLPTNRFMFAGFIPNKQKARFDLFLSLKKIDTTLVFYETAPRIVETLKAMSEVFGKREISVVREITKIFEECINNTADELLAYFTNTEPKGEFVILVAPPQEEGENADPVLELEKRIKKMSLKDAVKEVADLCALKKSEIYALALKLKDE